MKRRMSLWGMAIVLALVLAAAPVLAQDGEGHGQADDPNADRAARYGAAIYAEFCQACHGPRGEGIAEGPAFRAIRYDPATAREVIAQGRDSDPDDGAAMPAYAQTAGGPLSEAQLDQLVAYLATWETGDVPPLPEPNLRPTVEQVPDHFGDPVRGAALYATSCYGCHGPEGRGRVPPRFPGFEYAPETFLQTVSRGTGDPTMPGFGVAAGGPFDDQALEDLETYVASWSVSPPETGPSPEGWSTFLVILGVVAILAVGGAYSMRSPLSGLRGESDRESGDRGENGGAGEEN